MVARCVSTVFRLMLRTRATSLLVWPSAISCTTLRSRLVIADTVLSGLARYTSSRDSETFLVKNGRWLASDVMASIRMRLGVRLEQIAPRSGLQQLLHQHLVVVHGEDQDLRLRNARADLACHLQAVHQRERVVDDANIGFRLDRHRDSFLAVARLGDNLPVRLRFQNLPKAEPHDLMVVGNQDSHHDPHSVARRASYKGLG